MERKVAESPRQALLCAADRIERDGLYKGSFFAPKNSPDGPCCTAGALMLCCGYDFTKGGWPKDSMAMDRKAMVAPDPGRMVYGAALGVLVERDVIKKHRSSIVSWNDHPDRTKEEVVLELRAAAEQA